jgi:phage terminase large subunit-like protein
MEWATSCKDWEKRILAGESLITFPPLFPEEAASALAVFKELRLVDVLGRPTLGEAGRPWIFDFVSAIFGAYDANDGRRLITDFFLLISKKNSKSTSAAAIMMTALIRNWRESAEFLILAPTVEIANNSFNPARDMVKADEELGDLMHTQDHLRQITNRTTGATLKVIAADSETVGGKKATGILIDELWQFGNKANAGNMILEATGGMASRPEGFVIYLSTQSDTAPAGVFAEKLKYARGVRDGRIDDNRFLPVIYEFPKEILEGKKYLGKKYWHLTNPNLGASVDEQYIAHKFKEAKEGTGESMQGVISKHLNVQIAMAKGYENWAGADYWEAAKAPNVKKVSLRYLLEHSEVVEVGIDGGGLDDLLGICVLGREIETGTWLIWTHAWCHLIALDRRKSEAPKYHDFARDHDLTIVKEIGTDVKQAGAIVRRCEKVGLLDRIGVDQHGLGTIADELEAGDKTGDLKIEHDRIVGIPQGWRLNGAIKTTERKIAEKTMLHGGQPLMAWCVGNARVEPKGNAISITKQASGTGKIDPLMAVFSCVALMAMNPEAKLSRSIYDDLTKEQQIARITGKEVKTEEKTSD